MFCLLMFSAALLSAAVEGRQVPCDRVPEHGQVSVSEEGVYTFSCAGDSYVLMGESTARCVDGVFNLIRLPACAQIVPRITTARHRQKRFGDLDPEDEEDTRNCPTGAVETANQNCVTCPSGTYAPEKGTSCVDCPKGTYQPSSSSTECLKCAEGTTTEYIGSREEADCVAACKLPDKVYNGDFIVDNVKLEGGKTVSSGKKVMLLCNEGYGFNNSRQYNMACENAQSTFYNECYRVEVLPEEPIYELTGGQASVTCRVETSSDIIGFHVAYDKSQFTVEAAADRKFENGVAEQQFKVSSTGGAARDIKCVADVKKDFFETSFNKLRVTFLDVSIKPESGIIANVGEALAISVLVTYDSGLETRFEWTKDGETVNTISTSDGSVTIDGSQFFKSELSLQAVRPDDEGNYMVQVKVADSAGNLVLEKGLQTDVTVRGFKKQPSDEDGNTSIMQSDGVKLTCSYHGLRTSEELRWVDKSLKTFYEKWQTSEEKEGTTTSILQLEQWPEDLEDDAKLLCAVFNGADAIAQSEQITLQSHDYEVMMGSDVEAILGEDTELQCKASSPTDLDHPPTVTWFKKSGKDQDDFLEDGDHFVTNNKLNGTVLKSILTIATVDENDVGQYYCKAQYDKPAYIEIIGEDPITLSVTSSECDISKHKVENGKIVKESMEDGRLTFTVECDQGYWFSKGSGNLLYCDKDGNPVYPECERVTIETSLVKSDDDKYLLGVSYQSKSWSGKGYLCDDGWDNSEAELVCRRNGFNHGKAVSLTTDGKDFALTAMDCPCNAENMEYCLATRYEDSELPCLPEETAGVRCYNESLTITAEFQKARSTKKIYRLFMKIKVYKFGEPIGLSRLDSSSFKLTSQSVELKLGKASVSVRGDAAIVKLVGRKPNGFKPPKPHCVTVGMVAPVNKKIYQFEHCFS